MTTHERLQRLADIAARAAAATKGPWKWWTSNSHRRLRRPDGGRRRHNRVAFATAERCGEDATTTLVRFDGMTGARLNPPPMPRRALLASYLGAASDDVAPPRKVTAARMAK